MHRMSVSVKETRKNIYVISHCYVSDCAEFVSSIIGELVECILPIVIESRVL